MARAGAGSGPPALVRHRPRRGRPARRPPGDPARRVQRGALRARPGFRAPGHQARQRDDRILRRGVPRRLGDRRPGGGGRPAEPRAARALRHALAHGAGDGPRRPRSHRRAHRRLPPRRHPPRPAHRRLAPPRALHRRGAHLGPALGALRLRRRGARRARGHLQPRHGRVPGGLLRERLGLPTGRRRLPASPGLDRAERPGLGPARAGPGLRRARPRRGTDARGAHRVPLRLHRRPPRLARERGRRGRAHAVPGADDRPRDSSSATPRGRGRSWPSSPASTPISPAASRPWRPSSAPPEGATPSSPGSRASAISRSAGARSSPWSGSCRCWGRASSST